MEAGLDFEGGHHVNVVEKRPLIIRPGMRGRGGPPTGYSGRGDRGAYRGGRGGRGEWLGRGERWTWKCRKAVHCVCGNVGGAAGPRVRACALRSSHSHACTSRLACRPLACAPPLTAHTGPYPGGPMMMDGGRGMGGRGMGGPPMGAPMRGRGDGRPRYDDRGRGRGPRPPMPVV